MYYGKTRKLLYFPKKAQRLDELTYCPSPVCASLTKIKPFFVVIIVTREQSSGPQYVIRELHILWKCQSIEFFAINTTSPEVQNKGISGPTKKDFVLQKKIFTTAKKSCLQ